MCTASSTRSSSAPAASDPVIQANAVYRAPAVGNAGVSVTKHHDWGGLKQQKCMSADCKSKIKEAADFLFPGKALFLAFRQLCSCVLMWEGEREREGGREGEGRERWRGRGRERSLVSSYQGAGPIRRAAPSWLSLNLITFKASSLSAVAWGVRASTCEFWGRHKHSVHNDRLPSLHLLP